MDYFQTHFFFLRNSKRRSVREYTSLQLALSCTQLICFSPLNKQYLNEPQCQKKSAKVGEEKDDAEREAEEADSKMHIIALLKEIEERDQLIGGLCVCLS